MDEDRTEKIGVVDFSLCRSKMAYVNVIDRLKKYHQYSVGMALGSIL